MRPGKDEIKRSFSEAAATYDGHSLFQAEVAKEVGELLLRLVPAGACASHGNGALRPAVLDIGCGTGHLTETIEKNIPDAFVYGCDIAAPMLSMAKRRLNRTRLLAADCEWLSFKDSSFDMAASSLTLQWAHDLDAAFCEVARVLKPGGSFVFSTLGPETLKELQRCCRTASPAGLLDERELGGRLKACGFEVLKAEKRLVRKTYKDLFELLKTLKSIGAAPGRALAPGLGAAAGLKKAAVMYRELFSEGGGVFATYEVIFVSARKV